ncbi:MAG: hypothetical protein AAB884_01445 [Patescibacteria group bacterium]
MSKETPESKKPLFELATKQLEETRALIERHLEETNEMRTNLSQRDLSEIEAMRTRQNQEIKDLNARHKKEREELGF